MNSVDVPLPLTCQAWEEKGHPHAILESTQRL